MMSAATVQLLFFLLLSLLLPAKLASTRTAFFTSFSLNDYIENPWAVTMGITSSRSFGGAEFADARIVVLLFISGTDKQDRIDELHALTEQLRLFNAEFYLQYHDPSASTLEPLLRCISCRCITKLLPYSVLTFHPSLRSMMLYRGNANRLLYYHREHFFIQNPDIIFHRLKNVSSLNLSYVVSFYSRL